LHNILTRLKSQPQIYPQIDLLYSSSEPIKEPIVLGLKANGIRLRFDGPDQRLRLIEVLDFSQTALTYKNIELVRRVRSSEGQVDQEANTLRPSFRHIYNRLFGPSYPGEYISPNPGHQSGTYVLSYPGVAFSFPLKHKAWSEKSDFVSLLSSTAASNAASMAIFGGSSWPEARANLYTKVPTFPRSLALAARNNETIPDEIEEIKLFGAGRLELHRRASAPVVIILSETTPQDLVAELGPPDAIFRKNDSRIAIHAGGSVTGGRKQSLSSIGRPQLTNTNHSPARSYTEESDSEMTAAATSDQPPVKAECFYNYFHHGFDALVSFPAAKSPPFPGRAEQAESSSPASQLVVTKILLHANVPGSYSFNRHRRSRWTINTGEGRSIITSEMLFSEISEILKGIWRSSYVDSEEEKSMQRGMVLNRGWGESPESSIELLGGFESLNVRKSPEGADSVPGLGNTELLGFPGLLFEVLKNDTVSCLTVY
jgi:Uncharacterised protein family (UPF0183)